MTTPRTIPAAEKKWLIGLIILSALFFLYERTVHSEGARNLHLHDTYFIVSNVASTGIVIALIWGLYGFQLGVQTLASWSGSLRVIAIMVSIITLLSTFLTLAYFRSSYLLASDYAWPLDDPDAMSILRKQHQQLKTEYNRILIPMTIFISMQVIRIIQLFTTKPTHADAGLSST